MRNTSFLALFVLPVAIVLTPAFSPASIYSWRDASGVTTYSNVPPAVPVNAQITVRTMETVPTETAGVELVSAVQPQSPERSPYMATQAEFAVQLVKELGLGQPADAGQAADVLTNLRIAPPLGEWIFDQPMTPELTIRLRQLTVAAAGRGEITITPEQALLAFDTAAALLNVDIPASGDQDTISDAPYPIADLPPLIEFSSPPPVFYPYYIWSPIAGGFWWGNAFFTGYYVLNVGLFCNHYPNHYYGHSYYNYYNGYRRNYPASRARFTAIDPGHISHHVRGHIEDHALRSRPAYDAARTISSPGQKQVTFASMRSGRTGLRASQPASSTRSSFARPMPARPMIDRRTPTVYNATATRSPRSMNRIAFPAASNRRINSAGVPPIRSAVRGGMSGGTEGMRTTGHSPSGRRTLVGGQPHRSSGGVRAGSTFSGSPFPRSSFPSSSFHR
jgi:Domain of unknown function (DUF4124)